LAQSYPHTEIIVVDDGSKDRTREVVRTFDSPKIRLIAQANQGAAAARNQAFAASRGDYIQWLDADDLLTPHKIAAQMRAAESTQNSRVLYSTGFARFFFRTRKARLRRTSIWETLTPLEWMTRKMEENLYMQTATWLVSRELTTAAGPWDTRLLGDDDGEYFARVLLQAEQVRFIEDELVYYRISGGQQLSYIGSSNRKLDAQFLSMKLNVGYIRSLADTPRTRAACVRYLQTWLVNFHPNRPELVAQLGALARELGGDLTPPVMPWKYRWIERLFGWKPAKDARRILPYVRWSWVQRWDRFMYRLTPAAPDAAPPVAPLLGPKQPRPS
jgi:glycosyltransferase involved in cell wall biosynthesis